MHHTSRKLKLVGLMAASILAIGGGTVILAAPAAAAVTWTPAVAASSQQGMHPTAGQCGTALFVGVRGSAEADSKDGNQNRATFGKTVLHVRDLLRTSLVAYPKATFTVRQVYVDYSAVDANNALTSPSVFAASVKQGTSRLVQFLNAERRNCPTEQWVFSGFSQGAMVVDRALAQLPGTDNLRLTGVFNVADPYNSPDSGLLEVGTAGASATGLYTTAYHLPSAIAQRLPKDVRASLATLKASLGAPPRRASWPYSALYSYCQALDPVCNVTTKDAASIVNGKGFAYHGDAYYRDAFMVEDISQIASLLAGLTSTPTPPPAAGPITDPGLKKCVVAELQQDLSITTTDPTAAQIGQLTKLDCYYDGIVDLSGLQYATLATSISIYESQADVTPVRNVSSLSSLTQLTSLNLSNLSDLKPLTSLTNLTSFSTEQGTYTDLSSLSGMTKLTTLQLDSGQNPDGSATVSGGYVDLTPILNFPLLTTLSLSAPSLRDLSPLGTYASRGVNLDVRVNARLPAVAADVPYTLPKITFFDGTEIVPSITTTASDQGTLSGDTVTWNSSRVGHDGTAAYMYNDFRRKYVQIYLSQAVQ